MEDENDPKCGCGKWQPIWLQRFVNPNAFLVIFSLLGIIQGAYFAYLIGVLSTLEKRYSFQSKATGLILIADNISPILTSTLIGYYARNANRPKWIAMGMLLVVISFFMSSLPYFIYGPAYHLLSNTTEIKNESGLCKVESDEEYCDDGSSITVPALACFIVASFLKGFGSTAYYTIGIPFMDDNIKKKKSSLYLGINYSLRLLGPTLGFILSSVCLRYYEYPWYEPEFTKEDPRWIGAWWIGFFILGFCLLISTIPMFFFPSTLIKTKPKTIKTEKEKAEEIKESKLSQIKDILIASIRVLKNPVIFWYMLSAIFIANGWLGHYIFLPKYFETQFAQSASDANLLSGPVALLSIQIGLIGGALIIRKFKPRPQYIAAAFTLTDIFAIVCLISFMMMDCPQILMMGTENQNGQLIFQNPCNSKCNCTLASFQPICGTDSQSTYFSPCFAGCMEKSNESVYSNCHCVHDDKNNFIVSTAVSSYCKQDCQKIIAYVVILAVLRTIASFTSVGTSLIFFRSTDPKDKSLAFGIVEAIYCLFVFIPNPLIFGTITDAACLVWEEKCGKTGNCWIYDAEKFRYYLHGLAGIFTLVGIICDFFIVYHSKNIKNFYEDEEEDDDDNDSVKGKKNRKSSSARETFSNVSLKRSFSIVN